VPKTALASPSFFAKFGVLHWAFGISILVHALILSIKFVDPDAFDRVLADTPLDIILVNAKSSARPDKAQALAQANLDGGGSADAGIASSPLPAMGQTVMGDAAEDAKKQIEELKELQEQLLAKIRSDLAQPKPEFKSVAEETEAREKEDRTRLLLQQVAKISSDIELQNKRPKKGYISPATQEASQAIYYNNFKRIVEQKGTDAFPELNGKKLYGELMMVIVVEKRGRVVSAEVTISSGNRQLDRLAQAIVYNSAPFGAFPPQMLREMELAEIVTRLKFGTNQTVTSQIQAQRTAAPQ
jgi:periplasmic protein TonB